MTIVFGSAATGVSWQSARDRVREDLWKRQSSALPDDQVDRALHSAMLDLEAKRDWLWLENVVGSITMPSQGDSVNISGVKRVDSIAYISGTDGYDILHQRPLAFVREASRGTPPGTPYYYAISNGALYFDNTIAEGGVFEIIGTAGCPATMEAAIDAPPITLGLHMQAVVAFAAGMVAATYLKNEAEAQRQMSVYERLLLRLEEEEDSARSDSIAGSTIEPDDYFYIAAHGTR